MATDEELIASDAPLTDAQRNILAALADTLVPASDNGVMPSAGQLDLLGYLQRNAADFLPELTANILARFDDDFPSTPLADRCDQMQAFSEAEARVLWPPASRGVRLLLPRRRLCSKASA